eukprot:TRINITY_DN26831_c0_g2_i1.p1 TRINITY_DN26831_c0_g2~~TRINITY_DN26831_c0_g2_i1.p1  ORF type:complete len:236 (-),score=61.73 TRINITY_DN26831_c0_g2_i1:89-796(-)
MLLEILLHFTSLRYLVFKLVLRAGYSESACVLSIMVAFSRFASLVLLIASIRAETDKHDEEHVAFTNAMLRDADTDKDGLVSKTELHQLVEQDYLSDDLLESHHKIEANEHIDEYFKTHDSDGDDKLNSDELADYLKSFEDMRDARIGDTAKQILIDADADKDDHVTKQELVDLVQKDFGDSTDEITIKHKNNALNYLEDKFDHHDSNQDGKLDIEELTNHVYSFEDTARKTQEL